MPLFELKNYKLTFSPQALALKSYKVLWDRDKTKDKEVAINELSFIFFACDYKSDYADILDDVDRWEEIQKELTLPKGWYVDEEIIAAMNFYLKRRDGIVMQLFKAAKVLITKIVDFANVVDLNERDDKGKPIHNIKQINDTVKGLGDSIEAVQSLEKMVKIEISKNNDRIGSREKNTFEDGFK